MDDETLLRTMKNGLMIAGHEMGPVGDHWPAINAVSKGLEQEFEDMRRDEAVVGEWEFHIAETFRQFEEASKDFPPDMRAEAEKLLRNMWEHYYSVFEPVAPSSEPSIDDLLDDEEKKLMKSTKAAVHILQNMGGRT